ncbi:MAG: hypothetical protein JXB10_09280 [Pirellulales bacterium]|nr:hypothetical protein [Pirellulales bacterium]
MPRIHRPLKEIGIDEYQLEQQLTAELVKEGGWGQPLIIEEHPPGSGKFRVYVIWDQWANCPQEIRNKIIFEAYSKALGNEYRQNIYLAMGLTVSEAVGIGILPYKIECLIKAEETEKYKKCIDAMHELGAWERNNQPELRFSSREDADQAYEKLQKKVPGSHWAIVVEQSLVDQLDFTSTTTTTPET